MSKKFASEFSSNGAAATGDKLLIQKLTDSTVNYITVAHLLTNPIVAGLIDIVPSTGRGISIGKKGVGYAGGTISNIAITSLGGTLDVDPLMKNYMLGVFTKVTTSETTLSTDDLGSAWFRTRVDAGVALGAGYSVYGAKGQLRVYGGTTSLSNWAAAGLLGVLEVSEATTTFNSGCIAAAVYGNVSLTTTSVIASGAVVAGVTAISTSAAVTNNGVYCGAYIGKSGAVAFGHGLYIADSSVTEGFDIRLQGGAVIGSGSGVPSHSAAQGSLYIRTGQAQNATLYVNTNGTTGWTVCDAIKA
jgi:hypothetical protein